ncbi:MAG: DNA repair protein RecN [Saprospiraceae bacterium]|nr:DNA repair protein RecN [Saprospiraceae bacterium]
MLQRLYIKNFAIISELTVSFNTGLNIITGETGAGKSIMLDALGLALGQRADSSVMTDPDEKCIVEANFDISSLPLKHFFEDNDIDYDDHTILRRELAPGGRSRAFINDTPCRLAQMETLADSLVEVHQQFDQLSIREEYFQRAVLDVLSKNLPGVTAYSSRFLKWHADLKRLESLKNREAENLKEQDFLEFQLDELERMNVQPGEEDELTQNIKLLSQAEDISKKLYQGQIILSEGEQAVSDHIMTLIQELGKYSDHQAIGELLERLNSVQAEVEDLAREIDNINDSIEADPKQLEEMDERLAALFQLKKKHQVSSADELITTQEELQERLDSIITDQRSIKELEKHVEEERDQLQHLANELTEKRLSVIPAFEKKVVDILRNLGMPDASFKVHLEKRQTDSNGQDDIEYRFSSNKGMTPTPIKLTASGGEISRLNLAIKSLIAGELALPTMIFDEIDSGVSGEIARRIGRLLQKLGQQHQIVCITHTPQIASLGDHHLHVRKDSTGQRTRTTVTVLNEEQRIEEIGQMLGGDPPSGAAIDAARALLAD